MIEGKICSRSCCCISYIILKKPQSVEIVTNEFGLRMWAVPDNAENRELYNQYKTAVNNDGKLEVDLVKFNAILREMKKLSKNYKG